jgi:O-antigen/teichoic acid export membrane protein
VVPVRDLAAVAPRAIARYRKGARWTRRALVSSIAAGFLGQALLVVSGVPVARTLGVTQRGHLALLVVVAAGVGLLGAAGVPDALAYYISRERAAARTLARRVLTLAVVQAGVLVGVQAVVLALIFRDEPSSIKLAAVITLGCPPAFISYAYGSAVLQAERRFTSFNVLRVLPAAAYTSFVVAAVLADRTTVPMFTFGWVLSYAASGAAAVFLAARAVRGAGHESRVSVREMAGFGVRGLVGQISFTETFRVDQLVAGLVLGAAPLGLYAVATSFTTLPMVIALSIAMVEYAHVAGENDRTAGKRTVARYLTLTLVLCSTVVVAVELALPTLLPWLFGDDFASAVTAARILLLAGLARAARRILSDGLRALGRPAAGSYAEVVSWVALAALLAVLAPMFGINGVAAAVTISAFVGSAFLAVLLVRLREPRRQT